MKNYIIYKRLLKKKQNIANDAIIRSLIYPIETFRDKDEQNIIQVNTEYGKTSLPISIFEKILEDKVTYKVLEKKLKKIDHRYISIMSIDEEGNCEKKAEMSKKDLVEAIINVVLSTKSNPDNEKLEKCENLASLISYEQFLKKRGNQTISYNSYRGNYRIKISELMKFLSLPEKELIELLNQENINGIPIPEFTELIQEALSYGLELKNYIMPQNVIENKRILDEQIDSEITQFDDSEQPSFVEEIVVNEMLWEEVWSKVPKEFTNLEKAYYIYYELCKIFSFDEEVFINGDESKTSTPHYIGRLHNINKNDSEILCYEFASIYSKFLEKLGITYKIAGGKTYGPNHIYVELAYDNYYIIADSTKSIINGDLSLAKRGNELQGFFLLSSHSAKTKDKFKKDLTNVCEYIKKEEQKTQYLTKQNPTAIEDMTPEEKKEKFFHLIENSFLKSIDEMGYILELQNLFFTSNDKEKCRTCFIRDNTTTELNKKKSLITIICFYEDNQIDFSKHKYYIYRPGYEIKDIKKEELEEKLLSNKFSYINNGYTLTRIPGILREEIPPKTLRYPTKKEV